MRELGGVCWRAYLSCDCIKLPQLTQLHRWRASSFAHAHPRTHTFVKIIREMHTRKNEHTARKGFTDLKIVSKGINLKKTSRPERDGGQSVFVKARGWEREGEGGRGRRGREGETRGRGSEREERDGQGQGGTHTYQDKERRRQRGGGGGGKEELGAGSLNAYIYSAIGNPICVGVSARVYDCTCA